MSIPAVVFSLLIGSLGTVWVNRILSIGLFIISFFVASYFGYLSWKGVLFTAALAGALLALRSAHGRVLRWGLVLIIGSASIAASLHFIPGFKNILLGEKILISHLSMPYTFYANLDKGIVGALLLILAGSWRSSWKAFVRPSYWLLFAGTIVLLMLISLAIGAVKFDPKYSDWFPLWSVVMLFLVCIPEEAIYRGFWQEYLTQLTGNSVLALGIATALFSCAHYRQGPIMMVLAAAAGLLYGLVYHRFRSLQASIVLHFGVNLVHFLFFTYPFAAER